MADNDNTAADDSDEGVPVAPHNAQSPRKKGKQRITIVSPNRKKLKKKKDTQKQIDEYYPNKKLKPSEYLKGSDGVFLLDILKDLPNQISVKECAFGMFTILYVNQFRLEKEGNVYPLLRALGTIRDTRGLYDPQQDKQFKDNNPFCAVAARRVSKMQNRAVTKKGSEGREYREAAFVASLSDENNTTQGKLNLMEQVHEFLQANNVHVEVMIGADLTNNEKQSMDHYLLDEAIIQIIRTFWTGISDDTFYERNPDARDAFFSPPYPYIAHTELGYPYVKPDPGTTIGGGSNNPLELSDTSDDE